MISNVPLPWETSVAIGFAYLRNQPLTLEYDAGEVTVSGDDLLEAWDSYDLSDPFTIVSEDMR